MGSAIPMHDLVDRGPRPPVCSQRTHAFFIQDLSNPVVGDLLGAKFLDSGEERRTAGLRSLRVQAPRDYSSSISATRLRAVVALSSAHLGLQGEERALTGEADALLGGVAPSGRLQYGLFGGEASVMPSADVAGVTRWNDVLRRVVLRVPVNMVRYQITLPSSARRPVHLGTTPVTRMRTRADHVVQRHSVHRDASRPRCKRMLRTIDVTVFAAHAEILPAEMRG